MRGLTGLLLVTLAVAWPAAALADASVVVLGLRSVEGDDDLANTITDELRVAAKGVAGWAVLERSVSMTQMSLAHGCEEVDASCLSEIAKGLGAERIIYGTIRRTSAREDYDFSLDLSSFDAASGRIEQTVTEVVPKAETETDGLGAHVAKMLQRLSGAASAGTIVVQANVESAQVSLNGTPVGEVVGGRLVLEQVQPGSYEVEITSEGYRTYRAVVAVQDSTETTVAATLNQGEGAEEWQRRDIEESFTAPEDTDGKGPPLWVAYTLFGVAGASLVGMVVSWVMINQVEKDELYEDYRIMVDEGNEMVMNSSDKVDDVCQAAEDGLPYALSPSELDEVAGMCQRADTMEVLQWVFLGTGLVSGGLGLYFLLSHEEPKAAATTSIGGMPLTLKPTVSSQSAHLTATLRF
jgi:hypothetical protein